MTQPLLQINNLSLKIRDVEHPILQNINYQIQMRDFVILLGSNGSGKSSLLKILDQRYSATSGEIRLTGKSLKEFSPRTFSHTVKTLTQDYHDTLFTTLTLLENYLLIKQSHEPALFTLKQRLERDFLANYLIQFNKKLPNKLDQPIQKLSGGEKQAFALALSVLYPPKILLLDEHTSALDPKAAQQLMELTYSIAQQQGITCILATHDLDIAEQYGNRILALLHGEIYKTIEAPEKTSLNSQDLLKICY